MDDVSYGGDIWTAAQGAITLEIGIHGIPVTMDQKVYDDIFHGALNWYWEFYMDDRDKNYYKRVILGCIRALDYIEEYTPWNGKELGVTGSSQGGFLSLATAGLDKRITYYAPVHAALCDHTNSLKGIACGWPHYFYYNKGKGQEKQIEASRYYDGINFARLITDQQQGWFSFGYNDDVVPPTTAWETYNTVKGPKEIVPYQATWHFWFQEQWDVDFHQFTCHCVKQFCRLNDTRTCYNRSLIVHMMMQKYGIYSIPPNFSHFFCSFTM